jgi:HEPN domain-containing protein
MADVEFTSNTYREAALEHLKRAQILYVSEQFFLAHFLSGLAVECMLRAYRLRIDRELDSRHDLRELAKSACFYDLIPAVLQSDYGAKFALLNERWRSNQRYMSE